MKDLRLGLLELAGESDWAVSFFATLGKSPERFFSRRDYRILISRLILHFNQFVYYLEQSELDTV